MNARTGRCAVPGLGVPLGPAKTTLLVVGQAASVKRITPTRAGNLMAVNIGTQLADGTADTPTATATVLIGFAVGTTTTTPDIGPDVGKRKVVGKLVQVRSTVLTLPEPAVGVPVIAVTAVTVEMEAVAIGDPMFLQVPVLKLTGFLATTTATTRLAVTDLTAV